MSLQHEPIQHTPVRAPARRHTGFRVTEWALGIVGGIATFLGLFILYGADDQYVGLGGDLSWRVGDLDAAWGYGLLAGGLVALLVTLGLVLRDHRVEHEPGGMRESGWSDVIAHAVVFTIVNGFLWAQDIALGDGANYAYWVTIPWGIGLAIHVVAQYRASRESRASRAGPAPTATE